MGIFSYIVVVLWCMENEIKFDFAKKIFKLKWVFWGQFEAADINRLKEQITKW